jgi:hypothetical protein
MTWPFPAPENKIEEKEKADEKPPEKTPAELIAEALSPLVTRLEEQSKRFDTLEAQTKPREQKQTVQPNEPTSVLDDENLAFAQRLTPIMARQLELESRVVKNDIKTEYATAGYGELWAQFEGDINGILDGSPLVKPDGSPMRGDPQYIRNVVDMVFGRAARKGGMRFDGKSKGFFLESGSGSNETGRQAEPDGMTDSQRKVMSRMGVNLDDAKKVIKKLHFVQ